VVRGRVVTPGRPAAAVFPDRASLLGSVRSVLSKYAGTAVTVRQLYYRLVAAAVIPNSLRSYKNLGAALTSWRRSRELELDAFEPRELQGIIRDAIGAYFDDGVAAEREDLVSAGLEKIEGLLTGAGIEKFMSALKRGGPA
jgi:hypothetical protein